MFSWLNFLFILIVICVAIYFIFENKNKEEIALMIIPVILTLYFVVSGIMWIHSVCDYEDINIRHEYGDKENIYSLKDNINTNGEFILGCGNIDTNLYYYALVGNDKDGYIKKKYDSDKVYLIPEETNQPYYVELYKIYDTKYNHNFFYGGILKPFKNEYNQKDCFSEKKELHLPKNYIIKEYKINLQ